MKEEKTTGPGRPPKLQDAKEVQRKIDQYFKYCDEHPIYKSDFIRSGDQAGTIIDIPIKRPYTIEGLCLELNIERHTFSNIVNKNTKQSEIDEEIFSIITRAHERIRQQQIEGATGGLYNSNLVARINGIKEQTDITSNDETIAAINIQFQHDDE